MLGLELRFIIILVVHLLKDGQALLGGHTSLTMHQIHEDAIAALGDAFPRQTRLLLKALGVAQLFAQIVNAMQELAALAEAAVLDLGIVILGANFSLVVGWKMRLRD